MALVTPAPRITARVLVIVPTHDHAATLPWAVRSALRQTAADLEVVIIGDGAGPDTDAAAEALVAADDRVHYLPRPKTGTRGEPVRHEVLLASGSEIVTYLGDDDLLLAHHVECMSEALRDADFTHPFPTFVRPDGSLWVAPTDLSDPRCRSWHLEPGQNTISLTGAAHTLSMYRLLPHGWRSAPPGRWSDHYMWQQVLASPTLRATTCTRSTTIKGHAEGFLGLAPDAPERALAAWYDRTEDPGFAAEWDARVTAAVRQYAVDGLIAQWDAHRDRIERDALEGERQAALAASRDELARVETDLAALRAAHDEATAELAQLSRPRKQLAALTRSVPVALRVRLDRVLRRGGDRPELPQA